MYVNLLFEPAKHHYVLITDLLKLLCETTQDARIYVETVLTLVGVMKLMSNTSSLVDIMNLPL